MVTHRLPFFRSSALFDELTDAECTRLASMFMERRHKKGSIIYWNGEQGNEVYFVRSGLVKLSRNVDEREIILALLRTGDFLGDLDLTPQLPKHSSTAEAIEPTVLYAILKPDLNSFMLECPQLALNMLHMQSRRLREAYELIQDLTMLDVRQRIYKVLLRLSREYGMRVPDGGILIPLKLTHQQLASMAGTVRESATKVMLELQDEGMITFHNRLIVLINPHDLESKLKDRAISSIP